MKAVLPSDSWLAAACTVVQTITSLKLLCPFFPILLSEDHKSALSLLVLALSHQAISANKVGDDSIYFLQHFCVFLQVMCFFSNPPPFSLTFLFYAMWSTFFTPHIHTPFRAVWTSLPTCPYQLINLPTQPDPPQPGPTPTPEGPYPGPAARRPTPAPGPTRPSAQPSPGPLLLLLLKGAWRYDALLFFM